MLTDNSVFVYNEVQNALQTNFSVLFLSWYHTYLSDANVKEDNGHVSPLILKNKSPLTDRVERCSAEEMLNSYFHLAQKRHAVTVFIDMFPHIKYSTSAPKFWFYSALFCFFFTPILFMFSLCASDTL